MSTLELANSWPLAIRQAQTADAKHISRLLKSAALTHTHIDWRLPDEWLDQPGFVVAEIISGNRLGELAACLSIIADPPPAAWVRVAAIADGVDQKETWTAMSGQVLPEIRRRGVTEVGWLLAETWPDGLLSGMGFRRANWIVTYLKENTDLPTMSASPTLVRPVLPTDIRALVEIERAAFEPLWRHSVDSLTRASSQALSFEVAILDEQLVGFQYSVQGYSHDIAHLVRITVHPEFQGHGIGSSLLKSALESFRRYGIRRVSLNTQVDNLASHRLYERFGFREVGYKIPVWVLDL